MYIGVYIYIYIYVYVYIYIYIYIFVYTHMSIFGGAGDLVSRLYVEIKVP